MTEILTSQLEENDIQEPANFNQIHPSRREALLGIAGLIGGAALAACSKKKKSTPSVKPVSAPVTGNEDPEQISMVKYTNIPNPDIDRNAPREKNYYIIQEWFKKNVLEAIQMFEAADPRVQELIRYVNENAIFSLNVHSNGLIQAYDVNGSVPYSTKAEGKQNPFQIVSIPASLRRGHPSSAYITPRADQLRIMSGFKVKEWLGIVLLHELTHIKDITENGPTRSRERYYRRESKTHMFESKLLEHWDPKAFKILTTKGLELFEKDDRKGLLDLIEALYPVSKDNASPWEMSLGAASCLSSIIFAKALKVGKQGEELNQVYGWLAKNGPEYFENVH